MTLTAPPSREGATRVLPPLRPMLAELAEEPFDSDAHLFEVKWDGIRCLAFVDGGPLRLRGRRGREMGERYPDLAGLARLPEGTIVDGEVVVLDEGRPDFEKALERELAGGAEPVSRLAARLPATFVAFDLPFLAWEDLTARPLAERRARLETVIGDLGDPRVIASVHVVGHGRRFFEAVVEAGLEGMVAKRLDSPYLPGRRARSWLKVKGTSTAELAVIGYTRRPGEEVVSSLVLGVREGDRWVSKGKVGSGLREEQRRELYQRLAGAPRLPDPPRGGPAGATYRTTGLTARVRYREETAAGSLRAPVLEALRGEPLSG